MAYALLDYYHRRVVLGRFTNRETKKVFEYIKAEDVTESGLCPMIIVGNGKVVAADRQIFVGPEGDQKRYAYIMKTVVYVVVDETNPNEWVVEKWSVKDHVEYL